MNHFEALLRAYLAMADSAKAAPAGELSAERMMCIVRIVLSSPTLRQASLEYRANAVDVELANRMGAAVDDRGPRLVSAVWGSILMTALTDLADECREWSQLSIDDVMRPSGSLIRRVHRAHDGHSTAGVTVWQPPRGRECANGTTF